MQKHQPEMQSRSGKNYRNLIWMAVLSFIAMYILMYSMVNTLDNVLNNVNQIYMAGLMAAPMVPIEILLIDSLPYKGE